MILYLQVFIIVHNWFLMFICNSKRGLDILHIVWKFQDSMYKTASFSVGQPFLMILYMQVFIIVHK